MLTLLTMRVTYAGNTILNTVTCLPHGLGFLCSLRGSNLLFLAHCLLSKKLVAALNITGEGGAETITDKNNKTIQYIMRGNNC